MFKIALCDDDLRDRELTRALVRDWLCGHPDVGGVLQTFPSGAALLSAVEDKGPFDLYLVDILMPDLTGIDVGRALQRQQIGGALVYLTSSPDFASESYWVGAFFYLMKPARREELFEIMDRAYSAVQKRRDDAISLATAGGARLVRLDELDYAELASRTVRYHLAGGETLTGRSLHGSFRAAVAPLLEHRQFALCGASFVLNLDRVLGIAGGEARFSGGGSLTLPRSLASEVKNAWMTYWLDRGGITNE